MCGKRFRLHEWQVGIEKKVNMKCLVKLRFYFEKDMVLLRERKEQRDQKILIFRYGYEKGKWTNETKSLEETGKEFGVTRERIRQIEARVLEKIRTISWI